MELLFAGFWLLVVLVDIFYVMPRIGKWADKLFPNGKKGANKWTTKRRA